jgi:ABC-2 type transport system ATP-binding protein
MEPIITVKNISKSYGSMPAVQDLSFNVKQGDFFGFLGPNGAGKTTTIRMLTGIIPQDSGEITISSLADTDRIELQKIIGVIPESRGFYDWMSGEEYLLFFANLYNVKSPTDVVNNLLGKVGLASRKNSKISTYSRGMKQRIGLARALINNPKILFLDEPTLGLDPRGQEDIQNLLKQLNKQGTTIFFSSHQLNEVANLCSTVAIINHGKLVAQGTIEEIQKQVNLQGSSLKDLFLNLTNE